MPLKGQINDRTQQFLFFLIMQKKNSRKNNQYHVSGTFALNKQTRSRDTYLAMQKNRKEFKILFKGKTKLDLNFLCMSFSTSKNILCGYILHIFSKCRQFQRQHFRKIYYYKSEKQNKKRFKYMVFVYT